MYLKKIFTYLLFLALCPGLFGQGREITINIIVTTDVHGRYFPYDFVSNSPRNNSLASVHEIVRRARLVPGNQVILLDNGDLIQGTPESYYANFIDKSRRNLTSRIMNLMAYDAATVGNHDIEAGPQVFNRLKKEFRFPYLGANVINASTGKPHFEPYTIITRRGVKVAVLGLCTPGIPNWLPQKLWEGLEFKDLIESASYWVNHIKEIENPDALIGLFHSGVGPSQFTDDGTLLENASQIIAKQIEGFDVIFTGHDHREYVDTVVGPGNSQVLMIGGGAHAHNIGIATLTFNRISRGVYEKTGKSGELMDTSSLGNSREFFQRFDKDLGRIANYANTPVTMLKANLDGRVALFGPSKIVDLVHYLQLELTSADISIAAPLSTNQTIGTGLMTVRDFFKLYRFENYLYEMELTGQEINDYLEFSYGLWFNHMMSEQDNLLLFRKNPEGELVLDGQGKPRLLHPTYNFDSAAGITYTVDVRQPQGQRINITMMENGEPFDLNKTYRVALNSYRASGGGGHLETGSGLNRELARKRIVNTSDTDLRTEMINLLKQEKELNPAIRNNWKLIPEEWIKKGLETDKQILHGTEEKN